MSGIKRFRRVFGYAALAALALAGMAAWSHAANQARRQRHEHEVRTSRTARRTFTGRKVSIPSQADLFSHNELLINASCERIWSHIIDASKWPEWYPNAKEVKITGDTMLKDGTIFRWTTFGLPIESKVNELAPYARIGWYGYAPGTAPSFYHTWYLKTAGRCLPCRYG